MFLFILLIISFLLIVLSIGFIIEIIIFMKSSIATTGELIKFRESIDDEGTTLYTPVFEYRDNNHVVHFFEPNYVSTPKIGKVGDKTKILYAKNNAENARKGTFISLYGVKMIPMILGIIITCIVIILYQRKI